MNTIRAGFCEYSNPFSGKTYRISIRPEDCLAIVFWTRNPSPMFDRLETLKKLGYYFYFHFTITGYGPPLEKNETGDEVFLENFKRLSTLISPEFVQWRYDPIILSNLTPESYHLEKFDKLSRNLKDFTNRCYLSFVCNYGKTRRNFSRLTADHGINFIEPTIDEKIALVQSLNELARSRGISLFSCCDDELVGNGIEKAHCIDLDIISRLRPGFETGLKTKPTRKGCGCYESIDIGAYDTCLFGCSYCYATNNHDLAVKRFKAHLADDSFLLRPIKST